MACKQLGIVGAVGLTLAVTAVPAAAPAPSAAGRPVVVYFTRGEQLATVRRPGSVTPLATALRALFAGPTAAEVRRGFRTSVPARAAVRSVALSAGLATIDVSRRFAGSPRDAGDARLSQLVYTATQFPTVRAVRILVEGRPAGAIGSRRLGAGRVLRRADFAAPPSGPPRPPQRAVPVSRPRSSAASRSG